MFVITARCASSWTSQKMQSHASLRHRGILPDCPTDFCAKPPSSRHGIVLSPERTNECGPLMTRGGPLHKYSHVPRRGDTFPAFSKLVTAKEKLKMMNGEINGFHNSLIEEDCFLFTSESVGEGHPGKTYKQTLGDFTAGYSTSLLYNSTCSARSYCTVAFLLAFFLTIFLLK